MRNPLLLLLILFLAACGGTETAVNQPVTPPIVPANTVTTAATTAPVLPSASPTLLPTNTPAGEPEAPTAVPTDTATPLPPTATPVPHQPVSQIQLTPIVTAGLSLPLYLTHAGDGRLFVVQQDGLINIIQDGELLAEPFLDIRGRVGKEANEQGLLSVAFHPGYAQNGYFFVNYTNLSFHTVVSRFQVSAADPNLADATSEKILLTIEQPYANHNGGLVKFGPDGYLYIGMGDGGSQGDPQNRAQNGNSLLGKILRIDVDVAEDVPYGIPETNPFVADNGVRNEIWAIGLRNPWRFSFDRETGDLFLADVGQNQWEEVNFRPVDSPGGENYGWNRMEGTHCYPQGNCDTTGLILPIFEYDHSQGCSVTGGYMYRGAQFPALRGNYLVADYCTGFIWRLFPAGDGTWDTAKVLESGRIISSFGEDVNGELYVVDHNGGVYQIQSVAE
ncbi:MAG TPA: PQQ-dependent sugar dehydrogenase [Chloroflexota bacterium]|nr:PQQ-dependent sugar dehydrogenase [Chloroflexota bacterium]